MDAGTARNAIIDQLHVSRSTMKRYLKQRRETGTVLPRPIPGRPSIKGKALQTHLLSQREAHPGATLDEHCQIWEAEQGMQVSSATIRRAMLAMGWKRS
ncbi:MAG: hypothetical protein J2P37_20085 [Ktedonobacteraceae bacterium]|nr:hypothetical protein [Ktedonobacteraceae bacterium]